MNGGDDPFVGRRGGIAGGHGEFRTLQRETNTEQRSASQAEASEGILSNIASREQNGDPEEDYGLALSPGPADLTVTEVGVTVYNAEDPTCTPRVFTAGQGFVEPETVHILRNEEQWTHDGRRREQFGRSTGPRRFDAPPPGTCPF